MIELWNRNSKPPEPSPAAVRQGWLALADGVVIDLVNRANSLRFAAGDSLLLQRPELAGCLLLVKEGTLQLSGLGRELQHLLPGTVLPRLKELAPAQSQLTLSADSAGQLLWLTKADCVQLQDVSRIELLQLAQAFAAQLAARLAQEAAELQQQQQWLMSSLQRDLQLQAAAVQHSTELQAVIERIPRLPVATQELLHVLLDEDSPRARVVELVRQDPAMTATLLRAVNSPVFSLGHRISDLSHAVALLGFEGVYQIIMAETLRKSLPDNDAFKRSHQRAVLLSYIAFALAQVSGKARPAHLATLALLHDIGRVVLALLQHRQPACRELIRRLPAAVPGAMLLHNWLLPDAVWQVVALQHYPQWLPPQQLPAKWRTPVSLLYLAGLVLDQVQRQPVHAPFLKDYLKVLGVGEVALDVLWQQQLVPLLRQRRNALPALLRRLLG